MAVEAVTEARPGPHVMLTLRSIVLAVVAVLVLGTLACFVAFRTGEHRAGVQVHRGLAYVGDHQASVKADGTWYAVPFDGSWYDSAGTQHDGGTPPCLGRVGRTVPLEFGSVPVTGPDGTGWNQVAWVRCLPSATAP